MPSLSAYLAKNYLNASTPNDSFSHDNDHRPTKKRKKNKSERNAEPSSLVIADDDDLLLSSRTRGNNPDDDDPDAPTFFDTTVRSAEFRKAKKNVWTNVGASEPVDDEARDNLQDGNGEERGGGTAQQDDDADQLLRNTIANSERQRMDLMAEEAPAIVETDNHDQDSTTRMESGVRPGLQTAADTARMLAQEEAERDRERQAAMKKSKKKKSQKTEEEEQQQEETIYRDATGRRIDLTLRRAEFRAQEAAKLAAEKKERENAMGDVQLRQREERKQDLEDAKFLTLGRSADDEEYNDRLKDQVRWDDPMAAYMAEKRAEDDEEKGVVARRKRGTNQDINVVKKPRKKEYAGAAPPNRYGIKPGWRWDGVDRGNGFEKEWFQARGKKSRNERLEYEWQMDE